MLVILYLLLILLKETLSILMVLDDDNNLELALRRLSIESHNYVSNVISSGQLGDDFELKHFL